MLKKTKFIVLSFISILTACSSDDTSLVNNEHDNNERFKLELGNTIMQVGDSINYNIFSEIEPGMSGDSAIWDFTNIDSIGNYKMFVDKLTAIDDSMYIIGNDSLKFKDFEPESIISTANYYDMTAPNFGSRNFGELKYYQKREDRLERVAMENPINFIRYNPQFLEIPYSFGFGDKRYSEFKGNQIYSQKVRYSYTGNIIITADGYGKILLPNNEIIDNALRIKSESYYYENEKVIGQYIEYSWYIKGYRYPILKMVYNYGRIMLINIQFIGYYCTPENRYKLK